MANEYKGVSAIIPVVCFKDTGAFANPAVDIELPPAGAATGRVYMAFSGAIVGLAGHTTGGKAVTIKVYKNGAAVVGASVAIPAAANNHGYARFMPALYAVAADDYISAAVIGVAAEDPGDVTVVVYTQVGQSQT